MNINFNVCNGYIKTKEIGTQTVKEYGNIKSENRLFSKHDTVSISSEAASFAEVDRTTKAIASEVNGCASQDKINSLKAQIAAGTYNVSAGEVADAILDRLAF